MQNITLALKTSVVLQILKYFEEFEKSKKIKWLK